MQGDKGSQVTLVIPWLAAADQAKVYPNNLTFSTPEEHESYVRAWVTKRTGFDCNFKVTFYPGRYSGDMGSILPVGDPTTYIPDNEARPPLSLICRRLFAVTAQYKSRRLRRKGLAGPVWQW